MAPTKEEIEEFKKKYGDCAIVKQAEERLILNECLNDYKKLAPRADRRVRIKSVLSVLDTDLLREQFPEYELEFVRTSDHNHGYAKEARLLDHRLIRDCYLHDYQGISETGGYDIIDVGGNVAYHAKNSGDNVHVCCPITSSDGRDDARHYERIASITKYVNTPCLPAEAIRRARNFLPDVDGIIPNACCERTQNCGVQAVAQMSVHAVYDFFDELPTIMYKHGSRIHIGSFMAPWDALINKVGTISVYRENKVGGLRCGWERRVVGGEETITFTFDNGDRSFGYTHKWRTIMRMLTVNLIVHDNHVCTYETIRQRHGSAYFKCVYIGTLSDLIGRDATKTLRLTSRVIFPGFEDRLLLRGYKLDENNHLRRHTLIVPADLVKKIKSYCARIPNQEFNYTSVLHVAFSCDRTLIVNGTVTMKDSNLSTEDLMFLTYCCYVEMFDIKFQDGITYKILLDDIKGVRNGFSLANVFKRMIGIAPKDEDWGKYSFHYDEATEFKFRKAANRFSRFLESLLAPRRDYKVEFQKMFSIVTSTDELLGEVYTAQLVADVTSIVPHVKTDPTLSEMLDRMVENNPQDSNDIQYTAVTETFEALTDQFDQVVPVEVPGDGDCGYHALRVCLTEAGFDVPTTDGLKFRLMMAITRLKQVIPFSGDLEKILACAALGGKTPVEGWCDDKVITLVAGIFNVDIKVRVLHSATVRTYSTGSDKVLYLEHRGDPATNRTHFTPLVSKIRGGGGSALTKTTHFNTIHFMAKNDDIVTKVDAATTTKLFKHDLRDVVTDKLRVITSFKSEEPRYYLPAERFCLSPESHASFQDLTDKQMLMREYELRMSARTMCRHFVRHYARNIKVEPCGRKCSFLRDATFKHKFCDCPRRGTDSAPPVVTTTNNLVSRLKNFGGKVLSKFGDQNASGHRSDGDHNTSHTSVSSTDTTSNASFVTLDDDSDGVVAVPPQPPTLVQHEVDEQSSEKTDGDTHIDPPQDDGKDLRDDLSDTADPAPYDVSGCDQQNVVVPEELGDESDGDSLATPQGCESMSPYRSDLSDSSQEEGDLLDSDLGDLSADGDDALAIGDVPTSVVSYSFEQEVESSDDECCPSTSRDEYYCDYTDDGAHTSFTDDGILSTVYEVSEEEEQELLAGGFMSPDDEFPEDERDYEWDYSFTTIENEVADMPDEIFLLYRWAYSHVRNDKTNRSSSKFTDMIEHFGLDHERILDISAAPGGVHLDNKNVRSYYYPDGLELLPGVRASPLDLLDAEQVLEIADIESDYDLLYGDAAVDEPLSNLSVVDRLILNSCSFITALRERGNFILKSYAAPCLNDKVVALLLTKFGTVEYFRPDTASFGTSEIYIVARNYLATNDGVVPDIASLRDEYLNDLTIIYQLYLMARRLETILVGFGVCFDRINCEKSTRNCSLGMTRFGKSMEPSFIFEPDVDLDKLMFLRILIKEDTALLTTKVSHGVLCKLARRFSRVWAFRVGNQQFTLAIGSVYREIFKIDYEKFYSGGEEFASINDHIVERGFDVETLPVMPIAQFTYNHTDYGLSEGSKICSDVFVPVPFTPYDQYQGGDYELLLLNTTRVNARDLAFACAYRRKFKKMVIRVPLDTTKFVDQFILEMCRARRNVDVVPCRDLSFAAGFVLITVGLGGGYDSTHLNALFARYCREYKSLAIFYAKLGTMPFTVHSRPSATTSVQYGENEETIVSAEKVVFHESFQCARKTDVAMMLEDFARVGISPPEHVETGTFEAHFTSLIPRLSRDRAPSVYCDNYTPAPLTLAYIPIPPDKKKPTRIMHGFRRVAPNRVFKGKEVWKFSTSLNIIVRTTDAVIVFDTNSGYNAKKIRERLGIGDDILLYVNCIYDTTLVDTIGGNTVYYNCGRKEQVNAHHQILGLHPPTTVPVHSSKINECRKRMDEVTTIERTTVERIRKLSTELWDAIVPTCAYLDYKPPDAVKNLWILQYSSLPGARPSLLRSKGVEIKSSYMYAVSAKGLLRISLTVDTTNGLEVLGTSDGRALYDVLPSGTYLFWDELSVFTSMEKLRVYEEVLSDSTASRDFLFRLDACKIERIEGVAGCGKTTFILREHDPEHDLVLTQTCAAKDEMIDRQKKVHTDKPADWFKARYKTVDSYVMNRPDKKYRNVYIDEGMKAHPGVACFVVALSGCETAYIVGDTNQLSYYCREEGYNAVHTTYDCFPVARTLSTSYRCPRDTCALLAKYYEGGMRSVSKFDNTFSLITCPGVSSIPKDTEALYLTATQDEKHTVRNTLLKASVTARVHTVDEAQGTQARTVIFVRTNGNRSIPVYSNLNQLIVAVSRHTEKFVYARCVGFDCPMTQFIRPRLSGGYVEGSVELLAPQGRVTLTEHQDLVEQNGFTEYAVPCVEYVSKCEFQIASKGVPTLEPVDKSAIEFFLEEAVPGTYSYDVEMLGDMHAECGVQNFLLPKCTLKLDKLVPLTKKKGDEGYQPVMPRKPVCKPVIKSLLQQDRDKTPLETIVALIKRNADVPHNNCDMDEKRLAKLVVNKFFDSYVDPNHIAVVSEYFRTKIDLSSNDLKKWAKRTDRKIIPVGEDNCGLRELDITRSNRYKFQIKPQVKPKIEPGSQFEVQALQTIAFHDPEITQILSPIMKKFTERLNSILQLNVRIFSDDSPTNIADQINMTRKWRKYGLIPTEVDISKFDKSQGSLVLEIELELMRRLGMSKEIMDIWRHAHTQTELVNKDAGLNVKINYQRKSGDAGTFIGNTTISMCLLAASINIAQTDVYSTQAPQLWGSEASKTSVVAKVDYLLAAGDDTYFLSDQVYTKEGIDFMSDVMNFEVKVFSKHYGYFCSRFIIEDDFNLLVVPDPMKVLVKLGRNSLRDVGHVEEYRRSLYDLLSPLRYAYVREDVSYAIAERYNTTVDMYSAICALDYAVRDPDVFREFFVFTEEKFGIYKKKSCFLSKGLSFRQRMFALKHRIPVVRNGKGFTFVYSNSKEPDTINLCTDNLYILPKASHDTSFAFSMIDN